VARELPFRCRAESGRTTTRLFDEGILMNSRVTAILLLALVISGGATFLVYRTTRHAGQGPSTPTTLVVTATRTLEIGTLVKDADVTLGPWAGTVPAGMVIIKRQCQLRRHRADQPVSRCRTAWPRWERAGLAATIPLTQYRRSGERDCRVAGFSSGCASCSFRACPRGRRLPTVPRSGPCCRTSKFFRRGRITRRTRKASRLSFKS
jgi:hypothetical protein